MSGSLAACHSMVVALKMPVLTELLSVQPDIRNPAIAKVTNFFILIVSLFIDESYKLYMNLVYTRR